MIEPVKPPPDVDALARRLPRRGVTAERGHAMRRALLDAAEPAPPSWLRTHARGLGLGLAAAVCAVLAWRAVGDRPAPPPGAEIIVGDPPAVASAPRDLLPEGVHTVRAKRPTQIVRADLTITAPAGAEFDVDVRDGRVQHVTVASGWVVIAAAHNATSMVVERQSWSLAGPAAPIAPPTTALAVAPPAPAPTSPPASSRTPAPSAAPPAPAQIRAAAEPVHKASPPATPPPAEPAHRTLTSERDFRDGLHALLTGDAAAARAPLDRACAAPSSAQADVCYWAAVAWLRTGAKDHAQRSLEELLIRFPGATHAGEASVALGWLLLEHGDRPAARARFAAAAAGRVPSVRAEAARGLAAAR